ncbi:MAG: hypothetical protein Q7S35_03085 [Candidatus Limnocylindrales bacterium]|nr:hypothetical protein [Candidatus Limnocylindrales bacterium]
MAALPTLYDRIVLDAEAILAGDPAAESLDEVVAAYPGFPHAGAYAGSTSDTPRRSEAEPR